MTREWSDPAFVDIARLVTQRTGLVFAPNRCESFEQAVRRVMRDHSLHDLGEFERRLSSGALSWDTLIAEMTVGETYFLREPQHFEFLKKRVLPELAELRGSDYRPRVWSAGCATGEEAYSLAIALDESQKLAGAFVLGTDLSHTALARARTARYRKWSLRWLEPRRFEKYFRWSAEEAVLLPELAAQVTFRQLNLASAAYPSPATGTFAMDLIFCRNVLIYLSPETIASVARRFFAALSPGGFLITGPSDPMLSDAGFEIETTPAGLVYRRPVSDVAGLRACEPLDPRLAPTVREGRGARLANALLSAAASHSAAALQEELRTQAERAYREADDQLLLQLATTHPSEAWLAVLALRLRTNVAPAQAVEAECRAALVRHALSAELHYLHALTLLGLSQQALAAEALRRAIYLDPALAIAHFTLGSVLANLKDPAGAERSYRNALRHSELRPSDERVACAPEISARGLASAAEREIALLRGGSAGR